MSGSLQIGILGDYDPASPTLPAIASSIEHASKALAIDCQAKWLATETLIAPQLEGTLESFDGLWAAPGGPYRSFHGMLRGIEFARRRNWPFVGT